MNRDALILFAIFAAIMGMLLIYSAVIEHIKGCDHQHVFTTPSEAKAAA